MLRKVFMTNDSLETILARVPFVKKGRSRLLFLTAFVTAALTFLIVSQTYERTRRMTPADTILVTSLIRSAAKSSPETEEAVENRLTRFFGVHDISELRHHQVDEVVSYLASLI